MRDITLADTFYAHFTTRIFATGIPGTLAGTPVVSAYENDSTTQITAGITLGVDHDSVTGLNLLTIVATGANGYEAGKDYTLVVTTGTVSGVSVVGEVVAEFSIGRSAAAVDLANGTDGLTVLKSELDGIQADTEDIQTRLPAALVNSRMDSSLDATGFEAAAVDLIWDEVLTGATHNAPTSAGRRLREIQDNGEYENGAVYIDTIDGTAGTEENVNGTAQNPVDSIADARTIADSVGLHRFVLVAGSSITLAQTFNNFEFVATGATINMGSQDVGGCRFILANVTGTGTGSSRIVFRECILTGAVVLATASFVECNLSTTSLTLSSAAKYVLFGCIAGDAEGGSQVIDYGAAVGSTDCVFQQWSGGLDFRNMGQSGTDTLVVEGMGELTFNVNCTGGTATAVGIFAITNNGSGTITVTQELSEIKGSTFATGTDTLEAIRNRGDAAWTTGAGGSPPTTLQNTTIATLASQTSFTLTAGSADDDAYNKMLAIVEDASTSTQKCIGVISDYTGSSKTVTLREDPGVFTMAVGDTIDVVAVSPDILDILADTAEIGTAGAGLTEAGGTGDQLTAIPVSDMNMAQISGDATAADNLETMLDGTGGQTLSLGQLNVVNSSGSAIVATSSGSNGHGMVLAGNGSGEGLSATGGASGHGIQGIGGSSSGNGLALLGSAGNSSGFLIDGQGSAAGMRVRGGATGAGLSLVGGATSGDGLEASVTSGAEIDADITGNITGNLSGSVGSNTELGPAEVNAEVVDVLTVDTLADDYAADGSLPTFGEAVLAIKQFLEERSTSGSTVTVKKPDGSTTAMTFTLDSATEPTSITRAT